MPSSKTHPRKPLARCVNCGEPGLHAGRGLCVHCYHAWYGEENREILRWKQKVRSINATDEQAAATKTRMKRWREKHPDQVREWGAARSLRISKWKIGMAVWHWFAGYWCEGTLLGKNRGGAFDIVLLGGTQIRTCYRTLRTEKPVV